MELVHMAAMDKPNSIYLHHRIYYAIYGAGDFLDDERTADPREVGLGGSKRRRSTKTSLSAPSECGKPDRRVCFGIQCHPFT